MKNLKYNTSRDEDSKKIEKIKNEFHETWSEDLKYMANYYRIVIDILPLNT